MATSKDFTFSAHKTSSARNMPAKDWSQFIADLKEGHHEQKAVKDAPPLEVRLRERDIVAHEMSKHNATLDQLKTITRAKSEKSANASDALDLAADPTKLQAGKEIIEKLKTIDQAKACLIKISTVVHEYQAPKAVASKGTVETTESKQKSGDSHVGVGVSRGFSPR